MTDRGKIHITQREKEKVSQRLSKERGQDQGLGEAYIMSRHEPRSLLLLYLIYQNHCPSASRDMLLIPAHFLPDLYKSHLSQSQLGIRPMLSIWRWRAMRQEGCPVVTEVRFSTICLPNPPLFSKCPLHFLCFSYFKWKIKPTVWTCQTSVSVDWIHAFLFANSPRRKEIVETEWMTCHYFNIGTVINGIHPTTHRLSLHKCLKNGIIFSAGLTLKAGFFFLILFCLALGPHLEVFWRCFGFSPGYMFRDYFRAQGTLMQCSNQTRVGTSNASSITFVLSLFGPRDSFDNQYISREMVFLVS